MNLLQSLRSRESRYDLNWYASQLADSYYGSLIPGVQQTYTDKPGESIEVNFQGIVSGAYKRNGIVFACQAARLHLFSEARFQFRQLRNGRPGDLFGSPALEILEHPWVNGSTGELLARMIQDVDLSGNAYIRRTSPTSMTTALERLRPDWLTILLGSNRDLLTAEVFGYLYQPGGPGSKVKPISLARDEVAHWAPIPDPIATYRGMSWLTPVVREVMADQATTDHKLAFFEHGATPNMVVKVDASVTPEKFEAFKRAMDTEHKGVANAYKTLYLGGGADATVVGSTMQQMSFKETQGAGETRIAAAAGVPPIVVGLSEGLSSATYSNYAQARRRFADGTVRPLWRSCAAALQHLIDVPARSQLWYDDRDIPALAEDVKDAAEIQEIRARTIAQLVRDGFEPESCVKAVMAEDLSLLSHTGALSVQLLTPGQQPASTEPPPPGGPE